MNSDKLIAGTGGHPTIPGPPGPLGADHNRREMLSLLGLSTGFVGVTLLSGCGSGSDSSSSTVTTAATSSTSAAGSSSASSSSSSAASSSSTSSSSSSTSGSSTYTSATNPWPYNGAGTSTTAKTPAIADFATVIASGTVTYTFHASATSSTTDPITGVTTDTSASATLVPYLMSKYLVTNANWKAFTNAMGSSYYPSTASTSGHYWSGGSYPAGKEDHPVLFVSLTQAQAFCAWLETQISGYHFYVPTEGEWEYAALGTHTTYNYPWGTSAQITYNATTGTLSSLHCCDCYCTAYVLNDAAFATISFYYNSAVTELINGTALTNDTATLTSILSMNSTGGVTGWQYDGTGQTAYAAFAKSDQFAEVSSLYGGYTTAVGSYPGGVSWCGLYDMAGDAYEWTSTINTSTNGVEQGTSVNVVKGASWYALANSNCTGRGEGRSGTGAYNTVGMRVAARPK